MGGYGSRWRADGEAERSPGEEACGGFQEEEKFGHGKRQLEDGHARKAEAKGVVEIAKSR